MWLIACAILSYTPVSIYIYVSSRPALSICVLHFFLYGMHVHVSLAFLVVGFLKAMYLCQVYCMSILFVPVYEVLLLVVLFLLVGLSPVRPPHGARRKQHIIGAPTKL